MTGREKAAAGCAAVLALGITGYSAWKLVGTGILSWHAAQSEFFSMMAELPMVWLALFLIFFCDMEYGAARAGRKTGGAERNAGQGAYACSWRSWCGAAAVAAVFAWLHVSFLPMAFAAAYAGYLILTGRWFREAVMKMADEKGDGSWLCWDFLLGSAVTITVFCLLSLVNQGSIRKLRLWVVGSGVLLVGRAGWKLARQAGGFAGHGECGEKCVENLAEGRENCAKYDANFVKRDGADTKSGNRRLAVWRSAVWRSAMIAAVLTLVFLQAGRMNVAVDFDSIWYGVRSHVMLDSGNGIYENLGTLGVVYTYSKGLETLTLPLAGLPSYSFIIAFNVIVAGLTLLASYETAAVCMERRQALWVPLLMAAVPGIMNMADTAKADLMTLFCQILMLQGVMRYCGSGNCGLKSGGRKLRDGEGGKECCWLGHGWLALALAAGGGSLTMKPTAVIFSTAIVGMSLFWLIWEYAVSRQWRTAGMQGKWMLEPDGAGMGRDRADERIEEGESSGCAAVRTESGGRRCWLAVLPAVLSVAGIWGRTLKLVGVPVTSVFYQVFQKLGFRVKYPFYASGFPSAGSGASLGEGLRFLAGRLYGVLLNPQGDDMGHVIIAWGTVLPLVLVVLVVLALCFGCVRKERKLSGVTGYLTVVLAALLFIDLVSLYSLSQIDGNYYMLTYAVVLLLGCGCLAQGTDGVRKTAFVILIPVWMYGVMLCGLTNWGWALGNGGIQVVNRGYFPHAELEREKRAAQGSGAIWEILAADPKNRVIALGEHPGVLTFPCWVQSYVDVSGYWGNPEVVADAPAFLRYLQFAGVDYLYMEKEYVDTSVRIYQIVRSLVEQGWLYDVRDENGNLILSVRHEDAKNADAGRTAETEAAADGGHAAEAEKAADAEHAADTLKVSGTEIRENLSVFDERYIQHP